MTVELVLEDVTLFYNLGNLIPVIVGVFGVQSTTPSVLTQRVLLTKRPFRLPAIVQSSKESVQL